MINEAELLDRALEDPERAREAASVAPLLELASEVALALREELLSPWDRDRLYARALELSERRQRFRRLLLDRRARAIAGGSAVVLAAGTAVAVALLRQHRHPVPA